LVEKLDLEILEGFEGGGILGKFAGEGVEGFFGGVATGEVKLLSLQFEGAFGAVVFAGAENDGGVADEVLTLGFAADDLAEGFLADRDKRGLWNLSAVLAHLGDDGVGFIRSATEAIGPAVLGVVGEEEIDFARGGGGKAGVSKPDINGVVVGTFAEPDEDAFLLFLREGEEGVRAFVHRERFGGMGCCYPSGVRSAFLILPVVSSRRAGLDHLPGCCNPFGIAEGGEAEIVRGPSTSSG
jgi:hypothetical protein